MKLWIGRHSMAGDAVADPKKERERPLKPEGVKMAQAIAAAMVDAGEVPNVIFASPYVRATQTADIYGAAFGCRVNIVDDLSPDRPLEDRLLEFMSHGEIKRLMCVGHMDNSGPAMNNLGGDVDWPDLVMAEVRRVGIDRKTGAWSLKWAIVPSDLGFKDYA